MDPSRARAPAAGAPDAARLERPPRHSGEASWFALILLAATLFPRLATALGAPSAVKFGHFAVALLFFVLVLPGFRGRTAQQLVLGLALLFFLMCSSALLNDVGVVNVALDFLLLSEPFLLLLLIVAAPMSPTQLLRFRAALLLFAAIQVAFAYYQVLVLGRSGDGVQGIFLEQGAGAHVGGAVALTAACYLFFEEAIRPRGARVVLAIACGTVVLLSDSKQVLAVFLVSLLGISLLRVRDVRKSALYAAFAALTLASLWLARETLPLLPVLLDEALVRRGLEQKLAIGPLIVSHYDSIGHWLLGLGPGHSVGRVASLLPDYHAYLAPLGATLSSVTSQALALQESSFVSSTETGSSVWSPFFFWAGLWGDLGLLGLTSYLLLWVVVWRRLCVSELSRFLVLTILTFGSVFSWLEEPAYMLFVTAILGLEWQIWHCRRRAERPVGHATSPLPASSTRASAASRSRLATGSRLTDPGLRSS